MRITYFSYHYQPVGVLVHRCALRFPNQIWKYIFLVKEMPIISENRLHFHVCNDRGRVLANTQNEHHKASKMLYSWIHLDYNFMVLSFRITDPIRPVARWAMPPNWKTKRDEKFLFSVTLTYFMKILLLYHSQIIHYFPLFLNFYPFSPSLNVKIWELRSAANCKLFIKIVIYCLVHISSVGPNLKASSLILHCQKIVYFARHTPSVNRHVPQSSTPWHPPTGQCYV
jgi:hypothetical protein